MLKFVFVCVHICMYVFVCAFVPAYICAFIHHAYIYFFYISGKLHRHIVHLQVSEGTAVRKLQDAMKKIIKLEAHILNSERKIDQKDQTIYHNRLESRSKTKYLKHTIQVGLFILILLRCFIITYIFIWPVAHVLDKGSIPLW